MKLIQYVLCLLAAFVSITCSESQDPMDKSGGNDTDTIVTEPPNTPPVLIDLPDTSTTVGSVLYFWPIGYDLDGDSLIYDGFVNTTLSDIKAGTVPIYSFFEELNVLEFKVRVSDKPNRKVYFTVNDGRGGADTTFLTVTVQ